MSSATKSKLVRVHKEYVDGYDEVYYSKPYGPSVKRFVLTNPPPGLTATKLRRLVEIAAMDEEKLALLLAKAICRGKGFSWREQKDPMTSGMGDDDQPYYIDSAESVLKALGLTASTTKRRKGK